MAGAVSVMGQLCPRCSGQLSRGCCEFCGYGISTEQPEPDAWAITAATLENLEPLVTLLTGLRAKLLAEGFSPDAADALVVEASRVMTAQQELHARTLAAKREELLKLAGALDVTTMHAISVRDRIDRAAADSA